MAEPDTAPRPVWVPARYRPALAVGSVLVFVLVFLGGYGLGRRERSEAPVREDLTLTAGVPGRELVDLLADVDRAMLADPSEAVEYPAFFGEEDGVTVPLEAPVPVGLRAVVRPGRSADEPTRDPVPDLPYTLTLLETDDRRAVEALRARLRTSGVHAWLHVRREDGQPIWRVSVGAFDSEAGAEEGARLLSRVLSALGAPPARVQPTVVGRPPPEPAPSPTPEPVPADAPAPSPPTDEGAGEGTPSSEDGASAGPSEGSEQPDP